jgi:putative endonuclease
VTATRSRRSASKPLPERHAKGRDAEDLAAAHLIDDGFRVLWRNVRIGSLELDLVAKKDDLVVVVEVRTRGAGSFEKPLESVSMTKRRMLLRAVRGLWRGRLKKMPDVLRVRIDVIAVDFESETPRIEWIRGAFTESDVF